MIFRMHTANLGGFPLAARVTRAVLKSNMKEHHWQEILESKWWQVDRPKDQIIPVLKLSYDYLPAHLKQCFVYCSLFPNDYLFSVHRLVWLSMAQGYIQDNEENTMANIGDAYFKELLSRSFFERVDGDCKSVSMCSMTCFMIQHNICLMASHLLQMTAYQVLKQQIFHRRFTIRTSVRIIPLSFVMASMQRKT